ncbi:MAG: hypothetical protein IJQ50_02265 [Clostridia bacterium]|nr:hypothetical protein [Clostridia bacterium]
MSFVCNSCGKEFDDDSKKAALKTDEGTEYYVCKDCESKGVNIEETKDFVICSQCGFPCEKKDYKGVCEFCGNNEHFAELPLTEIEEDMLNSEQDKLYREKLGNDFADNICEWKKSEESEKNKKRQKRDRHIDTSYIIGIIIAYIMLEIDIRKYIGHKGLFFGLLLPVVLILITAPVFRKVDAKLTGKNLPLWIIPAMFAVFLDVFVLIIKIAG